MALAGGLYLLRLVRQLSIEPAGDEFRMNQPWLIEQGGKTSKRRLLTEKDPRRAPTFSLNAHQQSRGVHDGHPGGEPAQGRGGEGRGLRPGRILKEEPRDLVDNLEYGAGPDSEQHGRGEVGVGEATDPGPQDSRPTAEKRQACEVSEMWPLLEDGRSDAYALCNVVQREPEHEECPQRRLPEGERRADGQSLSQVVQPYPQCNPV